jgi:putative addiction module killer protein/probable addiction module antidote protein
MFKVQKTEAFAKWLDGLTDVRARARILVRIERLAIGNTGDVKAVGGGISELRIDYGPGYRVYFTKHARDLIILLTGGTKQRQDDDIKNAMQLLRNL